MSDEAAFLKALRDNPADDTTRLVYADWLDERNDPRAEFIRLRQQHADLTARINELAGQFDPAWLAAVGGPKLKPEDITLRSGRLLWLRELRQWGIYEGVYAGIPTTQENQERIERIVAGERGKARGEEPYLIQPNERPAEPSEHWRDLPELSELSESWGHLPAMVCVGRFASFQPAKDPKRHASSLAIIWFQDEFAFPIDPAVREQIRAIDWEKHATDFDY